MFCKYSNLVPPKHIHFFQRKNRTYFAQKKNIPIYILFADKKEQIPQPRTFAQKALFVHTFQNKICDGQKEYLTTPKSELNSGLGHGIKIGHSDSCNMS